MNLSWWLGLAKDADLIRYYFPFLAALFGVFVSLYFGAILKTRSEKRRYCLNAIAILNIYLEELNTGHQLLVDDLEKLKKGMPLVSAAPPKASWGNYQLSEDSLSQFWLIKDKADPNITSLPSHLKNCFEHVTQNVVNEKSLFGPGKSVSPILIEGLIGSFTIYLDGYKMTLDLTKRAINLLEKRKNEFWVGISEP